MFSGSDRKPDAVAQTNEAFNLLRMHRFFDPARMIFFDLAAPFERVRQVPATEGIEHELGVVPERLAQDFDQLYIAAHAIGARARAVRHEPFLIAVALFFQTQASLLDGLGFE